MRKPRILDLFCKAGGAARGYADAGFDVVGVDIEPQPHYPYPFILLDATEALRRLYRPIDPRHRPRNMQTTDGNSYTWFDFDAVHSSPPCQKHSAMTKRWGKSRVESHIDLIPEIRQLLRCFGLPWVIENVEGARAEMRDPVMLCGTMFGLQTSEGSQLRRHRLFETSFPLAPPGPCLHNKGSAIGVYGGGQHPNRRRPATTGVFGNAGGTSTRDGISHYGVEARREAMGIDWMTGKELSQAIPPAYTKWIGEAILRSLGHSQP